MIWHSYIMNPRWYTEDGQRLLVCAPLRAVGTTLSGSLDKLPSILTSPSNATRLKFFQARLGLAFDTVESAPLFVRKLISCPRCRRLLEVPYITPSGDGYSQTNFIAQCRNPACTLPITQDALGARLADTLICIGHAPGSFLPYVVYVVLYHPHLT